MILLRTVLALATVLWASLPGLSASHAAEPTLVFAASSMTNALEDVGRAYRAKTGRDVRFSFASSSALARQIEQGAPAQIFASADEAWMDYLAERNLIDRASRTSPIGNRLALVAPASSALSDISITKDLDLAALLGPGRRLSLGDPAHVPAGKYAKEALESLGLWRRIESRIAPAENVRVALAFVERGETPLGIVYSTDAAVSKRVKILGTFPAGSHTAITYPFALLKEKESAESKDFFAFVTGPEGRRIFETFGFARD